MNDIKIIKKLRERTGAGMVDCQKALAEAAGDLDKAVEILRKKGLEKAGKKAERETQEGLIAIAQQDQKVALVTLNCETDFVARNQEFIKAVNDLAQELLISDPEEFKKWAEAKIKNELIIKIGENIQLGDFVVLTGEVIGSYLHSNKKVAALVILSGGDQALAIDLAMQVAAMSPKYLEPAAVPADEIEKEKEIYREQLKNEGKPENVIAKIIEGKLNKFYSEVCLLKQPFIKDDEITVEQLIKQKGSSGGGDIKIIRFLRYQI